MITTQQKIIDAIYTKLNSVLSISVYENEAPQDNSLPFCIFSLPTSNINSFLSCQSNELTLQLSFYGEKDSGSKALRTSADSCFTSLNNTVITVDSLKAVIVGAGPGITSNTEDIIEIRQEYNFEII